MTPTQAKAMQFIKNYQLENNGASPSYEQIASNLEIKSKSRIYIIICDLISQNRLTKTHGKKRNLQIVLHKCPHCHEVLEQL